MRKNTTLPALTAIACFFAADQFRIMRDGISQNPSVLSPIALLCLTLATWTYLAIGFYAMGSALFEFFGRD